MYNFERHLYFPKWMEVRTQPVTGTLLGNLISSPLLEVFPITLQRINQLYYSNITQPRVVWYCNYTGNYANELTILYNTGISSGYASRATNSLDLLNSKTPKYYVEGNTIYFCSLTASATTSLPSLVYDQPIYYKKFLEYTELFPYTDVPYNNVTQYICHPQIIYNTIKSSGYVIINNTRLSLTLSFFRNKWDNLFSIKRVNEEDNYSFKNRISNILRFSSSKRRLLKLLSSELDTVYSTTWAGSSSLTLEPYTTDIEIENINEYQSYFENPFKVSYNKYKLSKIPISYRMTVGNFNTVYSTGSGREVTLFNDPRYVVGSFVRYRNYSLESSGRYYSSTETTSNLSPHSRQVWMFKGIFVNTLNSVEYRDTVINPDGSAKQDLYEYRTLIHEKIKNRIGFMNWKKSWVNTQTEDSALPMILD